MGTMKVTLRKYWKLLGDGKKGRVFVQPRDRGVSFLHCGKKKPRRQTPNRHVLVSGEPGFLYQGKEKVYGRAKDKTLAVIVTQDF